MAKLVHTRRNPDVWEFLTKITSPDFARKDVAEFIQMMFNRTGVSYHKYGPVEESYPDKFRCIDQIKQRLQKYEETHNAEWLVDAANYCMMESLWPSFEDTHFRATTSDESPGRIDKDGSIHHGRSNDAS